MSKYQELNNIYNRENKQNVEIKTITNGFCVKCKGRCRRIHYILDYEYNELNKVLRNMPKYTELRYCMRGCMKKHLTFRCEKDTCNKCGEKGHLESVCDNRLYHWNRLFHCGCNVKEAKRRRFQEGKFNHCCFCLEPVRYSEAHNHMGLRKLKCNKCFNNKRPLTPESDNESKKGKYDIPEPENPLEDMELDPQEESSRGPRAQCINCNRLERTMNPINKEGLCTKCDKNKEALERHGSKTTIRKCVVCLKHTDFYQSRAGGDIVCTDTCNYIMTIMNKVNSDKSQRPREVIIQDKVRIMIRSLMDKGEVEEDEYEEKYEELYNHLIKYINNEFEERREIFMPIDQVEEILDKKLPIEVTNMITEQLERPEILNNEPVITYKDQMEFSETTVITQPWEINKEFEWKDEPEAQEIQQEGHIKQQEDLQQEVTEVTNQEGSMNRIIELQNHIARLEQEAMGKEEVIYYNAGVASYWQYQAVKLEERSDKNKEKVDALQLEVYLLQRQVNNLMLEKGFLEEKVEILQNDLEIEKTVNSFINYYEPSNIPEVSMEDIQLLAEEAKNIL